MPHPLEHDGDEPPSENNNGGQAYIEDKDAQIFALRDAFRHVKIVHRDHSNDPWCQCPVCQVFKTQAPKVVPWAEIEKVIAVLGKADWDMKSRQAFEMLQALAPKGVVKDAN